MSKIGLKLWNLNTDNYFDEAQKLFDKEIYDYATKRIINKQSQTTLW